MTFQDTVRNTTDADVALTYFGHGCIGLECPRGERLVVDPYHPEDLGGRLGLRRLGVEAEFVASTHAHSDHAAVEEVPGAAVAEGEGAFGPFEIRRFPFAHDEYDGERFGGEVDVLAIDVAGKRIVHASDVGQSPDGPLPGRLASSDVLVVPVGGHYTAGAAQAREWTLRTGARAVVPAHYRTDRSDLPLQTRRPFCAQFRRTNHFDVSRITLSEALPRRGPQVLALEPAR